MGILADYKEGIQNMLDLNPDASGIRKLGWGLVGVVFTHTNRVELTRCVALPVVPSGEVTYYDAADYDLATKAEFETLIDDIQ